MLSKQYLNLKDADQVKRLMIFFASFIVMQQIWLSLSNTGFGAWWINDVLTQALAITIRWLTADQVIVMGSTLQGAHASMNIANGCDGVDMMLMLLAGLMSAKIRRRHQCFGALYGLMFLFLINILRLCGLFWVLQYQREYFQFSHGILAPFLMLGATGVFYAWWLAYAHQQLFREPS